jgi:ABC-type transport system involved in cytochrome bd biosynthesis fused ATPase/permease subunit
MNAEEKQKIRELYKFYHDNMNISSLEECVPKLLEALDVAEREVERFHIELAEQCEHSLAFEKLWFKQKQENQRLRKALEEIIAYEPNVILALGNVKRIARQALAGEDKG